MTDQENTQQEPTMEEILASIRRIISEDNDDAAKTATNGAAAPAPAQPAPVEEPAPMAAAPVSPAPMTNGADLHAAQPQTSAEVLELTQAQVLSEPEPEPTPVAPTPLHAEEPVAQPMPSAFEATPVSQETPAEDFGGADLMLVDNDDHAPEEEEEANALVSSDTEDSASAAFHSLSRNVVVAEEGSARSLEGLVQDMMRPMLKDWLDDNLGDIVEDVVEREVRRISDRGRKR